MPPTHSLRRVRLGCAREQTSPRAHGSGAPAVRPRGPEPPQACPARVLRGPLRRGRRDDRGRLLPAPRQEAEALPHRAPRRRGHRRRLGADLHLRPAPLRRHARRHRVRGAADPLRVLHLEGRPGRRAVQGRPHPGGRARGRGVRRLRRVRQPRRPAELQALQPAPPGDGVPRLHGRLEVLRHPPLRTGPPQDPRRRRPGRLRRRVQRRQRLRDRVARHPRAHHRPRRLGPQAGLRGLLEPQPCLPRRRPATAPGDPL